MIDWHLHMCDVIPYQLGAVQTCGYEVSLLFKILHEITQQLNFDET